MLNVHEFNRPLSGSERREIEFVNFPANKIKIKGCWVRAVFIRGQTSIKEEDYQKLFL